MIHALSATLDNPDASRRMALSMVRYLSLCLIWRQAVVSDRPSRCYQPRDAGFHDQSMGYHSRWYYHPDQDTCHLFVYRGLGGNDNNFRTLHECHVECISKFCWKHFRNRFPGSVVCLACGPSPDRGTCFGRIQMWYYEHRTRACAPFEYSGCRGNENKFVREDQCLDTCVNRVLLSHWSRSIHLFVIFLQLLCRCLVFLFLWCVEVLLLFFR